MVQGLPRFEDPDLIVGPEGFSDAGVYRLRDDLLIVQSLDFFPPLVDDPYLFGQIAAANSLSDVFAMGARPKTALNIVGFPDDQLELSILGDILQGGAERVRAAGAVIAGGHTVRDVEIKYGLSVTGVVDPAHLMTNRQARPGHCLLLTKALGTGFVTTAHKRGKCPGDVLAVACASMSQLNSAAGLAAREYGATAVTDITGFGLVGHARELAEASDVALRIDTRRLPILPGALALAGEGHMTRASESNRAFSSATTRIEDTADEQQLAAAFDAQTSGGLLISLPPDRADDFLRFLHAEGVAAACVIGEVVSARDGHRVIFC